LGLNENEKSERFHFSIIESNNFAKCASSRNKNVALNWN
jgi:hypothetical protein